MARCVIGATYPAAPSGAAARLWILRRPARRLRPALDPTRRLRPALDPTRRPRPAPPRALDPTPPRPAPPAGSGSYPAAPPGAGGSCPKPKETTPPGAGRPGFSRQVFFRFLNMFFFG